MSKISDLPEKDNIVGEDTLNNIAISKISKYVNYSEKLKFNANLDECLLYENGNLVNKEVPELPTNTDLSNFINDVGFKTISDLPEKTTHILSNVCGNNDITADSEIGYIPNHIYILPISLANTSDDVTLRLNDLEEKKILNVKIGQFVENSVIILVYDGEYFRVLQNCFVETKNIKPLHTNTYNIGSNSAKWKNLYTENIISENLYIDEVITPAIENTLNEKLLDFTTSSLLVHSIIPDTNNCVLGSRYKYFGDCYSNHWNVIVRYTNYDPILNSLDKITQIQVKEYENSYGILSESKSVDLLSLASLTAKAVQDLDLLLESL